MPRGPRLDAPGFLQRVMARGIERRKLFLDNHDRGDFPRRVAALTDAGALAVYAWAVILNISICWCELGRAHCLAACARC